MYVVRQNHVMDLDGQTIDNALMRQIFETIWAFVFLNDMITLH